MMQKRPPAAHAEEEISEELLDQIPDIHPVAPVEPDAREAAEAPEESPTLHGLLAQMQRDVESLVAAEFERIESSMTGAFADLETRLSQSESELLALREQNAALMHARDKYDRAIQAIKELTQDVEDGA